MRTSLTTAVVAAATAGLSLAGVSQIDDSARSGVDSADIKSQVVSAAADPELTAAIDAILADPRLTDSAASVVVRDAQTGEVLYERNPNLRLNPASNAKLFSSTAALDNLGTGYTFDTAAVSSAPIRGRTLAGDLYLQGGGDPTILASDYASLADQLHDRGIRKVQGNLFADDSFFDEVPLGTAWSWDDEPYYYSAVTSALTVAPDTDYDSGTVIVTAAPGARPGADPRISMTPKTGVLRIVNQARTTAAGTSDTLSIDRRHASNAVIISGTIPTDADPTVDWVTVPNPTKYAADVFIRALRAEHIDISGRFSERTAPASSRTLASHESMPVSDVMTPFMKLSNNMHAEALVKTMGQETSGTGSWDDGLAVELDYVAGIGVDTSGLRLSDGSGLSRFDLVSARNISDLLVAVQDEPWFTGWYDSLPIAGNPDRFVGGTLRSRMVGTPAANNLHGKTGSLTSVSALSGYVTNADGRELVFSMLTNNYLLSTKSLEDALGVTLASWSETDAAAPVNPNTLRRSTSYGPEGIECSWAKAC